MEESRTSAVIGNGAQVQLVVQTPARGLAGRGIRLRKVAVASEEDQLLGPEHHPGAILPTGVRDSSAGSVRDLGPGEVVKVEPVERVVVRLSVSASVNVDPRAVGGEGAMDESAGRGPIGVEALPQFRAQVEGV